MTGDTILKVLVGSQAHGLATPASDYDYKGVFVTPTSQLVALNTPDDSAQNINGKVDDVQWEIGKFLRMATQCNPTVLEVFGSPVISATTEGLALVDLFPYIWHPTRVRDAFVGYSLNQRKEFLNAVDKRGAKYAVAYLRVLYLATMLLQTGELFIDMKGSALHSRLMKWKSWTKEEIEYGEVIGVCKDWEEQVEMTYQAHMNGAYGAVQVPDLDRVNSYLLEVRRLNW